MFAFEPLLPAHEAAVGALQEAVYPPPYHEHTRHILARAAAYPQGSFVVVRRSNSASGGEHSGGAGAGAAAEAREGDREFVFPVVEAKGRDFV